MVPAATAQLRANFFLLKYCRQELGHNLYPSRVAISEIAADNFFDGKPEHRFQNVSAGRTCSSL